MIREGYMPFKGFKTYWRAVGECRDGKKPLILLHGGPGSTHNYFEVLDKLAEDGRMIVSYDQIGCGKSFVEGYPELFTRQVWMEELFALIEHLGIEEYHILGQSWGGMMAILSGCDYRPVGVKSYILSSANPSSKMWKDEQHRRIKYLPEEMQKAIAQAELTGNFDGAEYAAANDLFMERHCAGAVTEESPECLRREKKSGSEAYLTAWGPSEFNPMGNLKDFEYVEKMKTMDVPTLITSGVSDLCSPLIAKAMYDNLPHAKWVLFEHSRHMPFVEENERYMEVLRWWLLANE